MNDVMSKGKDLYDIVIGPIEKDLRQAKAETLMVSLDGALRYLPVSALYNGEKYVAEEYSVVIFTEAARDKLKDDPIDRWKVVGMGLGKKVPGFSWLPAVESELEGIIKTNEADRDGVMPGVIYMDDEFTSDSMIDALYDGYPVFHISSHFVFKPGLKRIHSC